MMKSMLRMTACTMAVLFAIPAASHAAEPVKHHMVKKHHGKMTKGGMEKESATAKLNAESLEKAKGGTDAMPDKVPAAAPEPASSMAPPAMPPK